MQVPKGYAGHALVIDLGKKEANIRPLGAFLADYDIDPRLWLGGDGFITRILWEDFPAAIDPLGPENEMNYRYRPVDGDGRSQSGRAMLGCISPGDGWVWGPDRLDGSSPRP